MKPQRNNYIMRGIFVLLLILLAVIVLFFSISCKSQKHITRSQTTVDSSMLKEKTDSLRFLQEENSILTIQLYELQYAGVTFDSSQCPPPAINIPANCNVDSILALLNDAKSKVKIYSDGTIEAEGKLKSAYYSKDKLSRVISELQRVNDSLRLVKSKEDLRYITNTVTKEKKVKRSWFTGWWLWLIFLCGGYYIRGRFGKLFGII